MRHEQYDIEQFFIKSTAVRSIMSIFTLAYYPYNKDRPAVF